MSTYTSSKCDGICKGGRVQYLIVLWRCHRRNKPTDTESNTSTNISIIYPALVASETEKKPHIHMVGSYIYIIKRKTICSKLNILGNQNVISKAKMTTLLEMHSKHMYSKVAYFVIPYGSHLVPGASYL